MRWDIRTTTGDETCIADEYAIDASGALLFYDIAADPERAAPSNPRVVVIPTHELVIAFGPAHWVHFEAHKDDE